MSGHNPRWSPVFGLCGRRQPVLFRSRSGGQARHGRKVTGGQQGPVKIETINDVLALLEETVNNKTLEERIIKQLRKYGREGVTLHDLYEALNRPKDQTENALRPLVKAGTVEEVPQGTGPNGGRPTVKYRLI